MSSTNFSIPHDLNAGRNLLLAEMQTAPKQGAIDLCRIGQGGMIVFGSRHFPTDKYFAERKIVSGNEVFGDKLDQDAIYNKVSAKIRQMIECVNGEIVVTQDMVDELIYPVSQQFLAEAEAMRLRDPSLADYVSDPEKEYPEEFSFKLEDSKHFCTRKIEKKRMVHLQDLTSGLEHPRTKELRFEVSTYHDLVNRRVGFVVTYEVDRVQKSWFSMNPCSQD